MKKLFLVLIHLQLLDWILTTPNIDLNPVVASMSFLELLLCKTIMLLILAGTLKIAPKKLSLGFLWFYNAATLVACCWNLTAISVLVAR